MSNRAFIAHVLAVMLGFAPWAAIAWVAKLTYDAVVAMATAPERAHPVLQLIATSNRLRSFAFLLGILGVLYGIVQAELRNRAEASLRATLGDRSSSSGV